MITSVVYVRDLIKYLSFYQYLDRQNSDAEDDYAYGFFAPKDEFKEMFKYIVSYGDNYDNCKEAFNLYLVKNPKYEVAIGAISVEPTEIFTMKFPDEETFFYFKLKFMN